MQNDNACQITNTCTKYPVYPVLEVDWYAVVQLCSAKLAPADGVDLNKGLNK